MAVTKKKKPARSARGKKKRRAEQGKGALEIAGEALHSLRTAPVSVTAAYCAGTIPFVLGFLYYWSDMSRSAFARERCFPASFGIMLLFLWMKSWQAVFADGLRAHLTSQPASRWTARRVIRLVAVQTAIQPYGLILIPISILVMLPFYCVYSFYQNITVMGNGMDLDIRSLIKRAWRQALLRPKQNHVLMWLINPWVLASGLVIIFGSAWLAVSLTPEIHNIKGMLWFMIALIMIFYFLLPLSPFGCVVAGNIAVLIVILPMLLHSLLGIETVFTLRGWQGIFSTMFVVTIYGMSYLCLDPISKAAYVLRVFYGESRQSGEDMKVELRRIRDAESNLEQ